MNPMIMDRLSGITGEEKAILNGRKSIDRSLYMDGSRDVISGEKLLEKGKLMRTPRRPPSPLSRNWALTWASPLISRRS
ncbi:MAG: hypothetical protein Q4E38_04755 [Eubacteriales bacterium]|nr:hypothetical protein [Eubacteriales bacterium]